MALSTPAQYPRGDARRRRLITEIDGSQRVSAACEGTAGRRKSPSLGGVARRALPECSPRRTWPGHLPRLASPSHETVSGGVGRAQWAVRPIFESDKNLGSRLDFARFRGSRPKKSASIIRL